jgi:SAM-dependent methyltransferase
MNGVRPLWERGMRKRHAGSDNRGVERLASRLLSWFRRPSAASKEQTDYVYQPTLRAITHEQAVDTLIAQGHRLQKGWVDIESSNRVSAIVSAAGDAGIPLHDVILDSAAYQEYLLNADYAGRYPGYYVTNLSEKTLEHFICLTYLCPKFGQVLIDVASEHSPLPEIFERLSGCTSYGQDIMYPAGLYGRRIGGDACDMPVDSGFADMVCLTCSLEHFEGNSDTNLFRELYRVLKPGGRVIVVPFYLSDTYEIQTDPVVSVSAEVPFDPEATLYCAEGWGNRHSRFYSPLTFKRRIMEPCQDLFAFTCYKLNNLVDFPEGIHLRFFFVAVRQ